MVAPQGADGISFLPQVQDEINDTLAVRAAVDVVTDAVDRIRFSDADLIDDQLVEGFGTTVDVAYGYDAAHSV